MTDCEGLYVFILLAESRDYLVVGQLKQAYLVIVGGKGKVSASENMELPSGVAWLKLPQLLEVLGEPKVAHCIVRRRGGCFDSRTFVHLFLRHYHFVVFWVDVLCGVFFVSVVIFWSDNVESPPFEMFRKLRKDVLAR
jgi:hypothetical protein